MSDKKQLKKNKKQEGSMNVTSQLGEVRNEGDDAKTETPRTENPADLDVVVSISSAEEACPSTRRTRGKIVLGKRGRASSCPEATSSSSGDSRPPPQAKRKVDAKVKKRIPFSSEDDSKEDSNQEEGPDNLKDKGKRLDRQSRRDNREKRVAELADNAARMEEKKV